MRKHETLVLLLSRSPPPRSHTPRRPLSARFRLFGRVFAPRRPVRAAHLQPTFLSTHCPPRHSPPQRAVIPIARSLTRSVASLLNLCPADVSLRIFSLAERSPGPESFSNAFGTAGICSNISMRFVSQVIQLIQLISGLHLLK